MRPMKLDRTLFLSIWTLFFSILPFQGFAGEVKPKFGPDAVPLSVSHEYFAGHPAPGFWALIPYYMPQMTHSSCSVASVAMILNAARAGKPLTADDKLVNEEDLQKKVNQGAWKKILGMGRGVSLDELKPLVEASFKAYGIQPLKIEAIHANNSDLSRKKLHEALEEAGKSSRVFVLANFLQGVYTGDADVGHFSPIGAYDEAKKRVLVLDVDREYYEPYWVSEDVLFKGMATADSGGSKNRGFISVTLH